jgi:hypothetical protein
MDLWVPLGIAHILWMDPSNEPHKNNVNRVKDNCLFWVSFNLSQLMTCFSLFLLAPWYLDIFKDSLWISYIIPLPFLPHEWMEFQFPHEGSSSVNGLERARLFKSPFPYE